MALTTSDNIVIYASDPDSSKRILRAPVMKVNKLADDDGNFYGTLSCYDADGNHIGTHTFKFTSSDLIDEESGFAAAFATVEAAFEKAVKTQLEAIPSNSGATITYS